MDADSVDDAEMARSGMVQVMNVIKPAHVGRPAESLYGKTCSGKNGISAQNLRRQNKLCASGIFNERKLIRVEDLHLSPKTINHEEDELHEGYYLRALRVLRGSGLVNKTQMQVVNATAE